MKLQYPIPHNWRRSTVYLFPILLMLLAAACTKPQIAIQNAYNGDNNTNVVTVDTFAVKMSTVLLDSFVTSGTAAQLLGCYNDSLFGFIQSQSFTDIGLPSPLPTLDDYSVYDSIILITRINRSFYGDTTKVQRFNVSQLTQVLDIPNGQNFFYDLDSIPFDPTILGSADVQINPTAGLTSQRIGDTIKIKMPYSLGQTLFGLLYRQPDTVTQPAIFRGYFKGLTVYPDTHFPGAMYGFKDTMVLRIFYHEPGVVTVQETADFTTINQFVQFNHISVNRSGTPIQSISRLNPELQSTATGNKAFFQPITNISTKLLFPTISNLLGYPDYLAVMKAELVIKPVQGSYSPQFSLPPQVNLALTNTGNLVGTVLPYGTGNLSVDYLYGTNTNYSYDITSYIQNALTVGAPNNAINGIILTVPATFYNTTFNRTILGDQYNLKQNQISLLIYYASYY